MIDTRFQGNNTRNLRNELEEALALAPGKIRFRPALRRAYYAYSAEMKSRKTLPAAAFCLGLFNFGLLLDYRFAPQLIWQFAALRLCATTAPILLVVWFASRLKNHGMRDWLTASGLIWGGIMLNILVGMRGATAAHLAFTIGLYLIVINIVFHLRPRVATSLSSLVCITTVFFIWRRVTVFDDQTVLALTFVIAATIITLLANFRHDAMMRYLYLLILREQMRAEDMEEANQELSAISYTDALTGVSNRRRFDLEFELACGTPSDLHSKIALLLIDVDHFKRYNDTHGHPAGDACLQQVAAKISDQVRRDQDVLARIGGEEFAIILRDATPEAAERVAQRIHAAMNTDWPQGVPAVTVSIGVAVMQASSSRAVMKAADEALYEAKERGRNRTITTAMAA